MFVNNNGEIILTKQFPRWMTWRKAKKLSVKKWEFIVAQLKDGKRIFSDGATGTCGLCVKASGKEHHLNYNCQKCPINKLVGGIGCNDTPYNDWHEAMNLSTAKAELDFLKSL